MDDTEIEVVSNGFIVTKEGIRYVVVSTKEAVEFFNECVEEIDVLKEKLADAEKNFKEFCRQIK